MIKINTCLAVFSTLELTSKEEKRVRNFLKKHPNLLKDHTPETAIAIAVEELARKGKISLYDKHRSKMTRWETMDVQYGSENDVTAHEFIKGGCKSE